jgi:hypothetical protein
MTDTPNFEDVAGTAFEEQSPEVNPTTEAPLQISEGDKPTEDTPEATGQVTEENFTAFNPNNLTPEMQTVYKRWQADYTQKRQAEKAELKTLQEKVKQFEQPGNQPQTEISNSYQRDRANGSIDPGMTLEEYGKRLKQDIMSEIQTGTENTYIESQEKQFFEVDPRFQEGPARDPVLLNYVLAEVGTMRDQYEAENGNVLGFDFVGQAKKLVETYDKRIEETNKAFVAKQSELAKSNASRSAKNTPNTTNHSGKSSGKKSIDDAFEAALESTGTEF